MLNKFKLPTRKLVFMALMVATNIILVRLIGINVSPNLRIDFGYLSNVMAGMVLGPVLGGLTAGMSDILGVIISGQIGTYFPLFTVNAVLYGVTYGIFFYKKELTDLRISLCILTALLFLGVVLYPIWSYLFYQIILKKPALYFSILTTSIIKAVIFFPIQIVTIKLISRHLIPYIDGFTDAK